jgi:hypothetical protein
VTLPLFGAYVAWSGIDPGEVIRHNWKWGVGGAVVVGALMVMAVFRQDSSARPEGQELVTDLLWFGVVYGLLDALLLSVLPVLATWHAFRTRGWTEGWVRKVGVGALAILASMLVTATYHLGYEEYRGGDVFDPLVGNSIMTLGYVLTNNPITSVASHIAMHIAAVLQGAETTSQLPPHY